MRKRNEKYWRVVAKRTRLVSVQRIVGKVCA